MLLIKCTTHARPFSTTDANANGKVDHCAHEQTDECLNPYLN
jgi:hypothetical protein